MNIYIGMDPADWPDRSLYGVNRVPQHPADEYREVMLFDSFRTDNYASGGIHRVAKLPDVPLPNDAIFPPFVECLWRGESLSLIVASFAWRT